MDEWQKALVLVMRKLGIVEILIEQRDLDALQGIEDADKVPCPVVFQGEDGIHVRIISAGEAKGLQEGASH